MLDCCSVALCCFYVILSQLAEHNGEEDHTEEHEEQNGEEGSQEEGVVVDADSTDGAVLINGNEADEDWSANNKEDPST